MSSENTEQYWTSNKHHQMAQSNNWPIHQFNNPTIQQKANNNSPIYHHRHQLCTILPLKSNIFSVIRKQSRLRRQLLITIMVLTFECPFIFSCPFFALFLVLLLDCYLNFMQFSWNFLFFLFIYFYNYRKNGILAKALLKKNKNKRNYRVMLNFCNWCDTTINGHMSTKREKAHFDPLGDNFSSFLIVN